MTNVETKQQLLPVNPRTVFAIRGMGVYAKGQGEFEGKIYAYECSAGMTLEEVNRSIIGRKLSERVLQCDPTFPATNYVPGVDIRYNHRSEEKFSYPNTSLGMWRELKGFEEVPDNV